MHTFSFKVILAALFFSDNRFTIVKLVETCTFSFKVLVVALFYSDQ